MYLNNVGIRKIAKFMDCSAPVVLDWIKAFGKQVSAQLQNDAQKVWDQMPDIIEMDEIYTFVKKTAKGSCMACLLSGSRSGCFLCNRGG